MSNDKKTPKTTQEDIANMQEELDLSDKDLKKLAERLAFQKEITEWKKESVRITLEQQARNMEVAATLGDINAQYDAANKFLEAKEEFDQDAINSTLSHAEAQAKFAAQMGYSKDQLDAMEKKAKALKDEFDEMGEAGQAAADLMTPAFSDIATKMGLISPKGNKIISQMLHMGKLASSEGGIKGMVVAFKSVINPLSLAIGLFSKIMEQTIKYAMAVDNASAAFAKQTGAGRMMTKSISNVGAANRRFGIHAKEAGEAAAALFEQFPTFQHLNKGAQEQMMKTTAGLKRLGVSMDTTTEAMMFMSKNLGVTAKDAAGMATEIAMTGKALGMSASKITKEFNSSMKVLAVYGKKAPKIFKGVAAAAQAAGVEINDLLGLAGKFDTFAGAAESTAKLNAIMGTQLSSTKMLMATEEERIEMLMRSMQAQGKQFKHMDRFTQKAIANAVGIQDMSKAQKVFGMSLGQYKDFKNAAEDNAAAEEEFNKRMQEAMTVAEKLQAAFMELAITLGPFVEETLIPMIEWMGEFLAEWGQWIAIGGAIVSGIIILGSVMWALGGIIGGVGTTMAFFSKIGGKGMEKNMSKLGLKSALASKGIGKAKLEVAQLTAAATPGAIALGGMASAFTAITSSAPAMTGILKPAGKAVKAFGRAAASSATGVAALVVPMGSLAAAVWALVTPFLLIILGIALIVALIIGVIYAMIEGAKAMVGYTTEMLILTSAMYSFAFAAVAAGAGFYLIGAGITAIAAGLAAIGANPFAWLALGLLVILFGAVIQAATAMTAMATAVGTMAGSLAQLAGVDLSKSLGELGPALKKAQADLDALEGGGGVKITSVLENMALITTGTSAEKMKGPTVGGVVSNALGGMADMFKEGFKNAEKRKVSLTLDGENTVKLLRGQIADADADTSFFA